MNCSYCKQIINRNLTLKELLLPEKISNESLCSSCSSKFRKLLKKECCPGCCRPNMTDYCKDCLTWQQAYPSYPFCHEAIFTYNYAMQEWFEEYKFKGNYTLRYSFNAFLKDYFKKKKEFLVIPMPISKERMESRGFNQVEGLLTAASISFHPYLIRVKDSKSQVLKTRKERLELQQPFQLTEIGRKAVQKKKVILVDDIYTTGRTIFHAAHVILENNPEELYTFSIAR